MLDNFGSINDLVALIENTQIESAKIGIHQSVTVRPDEVNGIAVFGRLWIFQGRSDWIARMKEIEPALEHARIVVEYTDSSDDYTQHFTDVYFEHETEHISAKFSICHSYTEPRNNEEVGALGNNALDNNALDDNE